MIELVVNLMESIMSRKVFMIAGPNGAGKTTTAMSLISNIEMLDEFINVDEIARGLAPMHPEPAIWKKLKRSHMASKHQSGIHEILLEAHRKGIEQAIDLSIRTGVPLVVAENGKIKEIKPKYKYVRVLIQSSSAKRSQRKKG